MVIENRGSRNGNSRRELASVGTRGSLFPDWQEELPSEKVVNNEASGLSERGKMSPLTANEASRLHESGSIVQNGHGIWSAWQQ